MIGATRSPLALPALLGILALSCTGFGETARPEAAIASRSLAEGGELRLRIRTASTRVEVEDLEAAHAEATAAIQRAGGWVEDTNRSERSASIRARVPAAELDATLDAFAALGEELDRNVHTSDVTDQVEDLDAQLANQTALRDRLRKLLDRAKDVEDVLAIEKELTRVQTQVDLLTARLDRLRKDVALSVVNLTLEQPERTIYGPLGYLLLGAGWVVKKLFVISP